MTKAGLGDVSPTAPRQSRGLPALSEGIIAHYEHHGREWDADRRRIAWHDKPWHDRFVSALSVHASVLDLGCGGGMPVASNMVERGLRVTGVDGAATMIALCRERMPDAEWIVADMRWLALPRTFDAILAWDSFFHLSFGDQREMFGVFARHCAPGTVLMFNAGPSHGERIGCYRNEKLYHASLAPAQYAALLDGAGYDLIAHTVEDASIGGRTAWLARAR